MQTLLNHLQKEKHKWERGIDEAVRWLKSVCVLQTAVKQN